MKNIFHHRISVDLVVGTEAKSVVKSVNNGGFGIARQITDTGNLICLRVVVLLKQFFVRSDSFHNSACAFSVLISKGVLNIICCFAAL